MAFDAIKTRYHKVMENYHAKRLEGSEAKGQIHTAKKHAALAGYHSTFTVTYKDDGKPKFYDREVDRLRHEEFQSLLRMGERVLLERPWNQPGGKHSTVQNEYEY
ncbi:MAG: hypothetical protein KGH64_02170 [Candidatus Micrarchaeota archaeon]|nr:hypothetical protein [Candidatus Micrarchaeota archaeon]MDE1834123.1 hypothetical protein [Candidatus Micrarchaeota archaeon]MDE1859038.1 hypothetical protein [Candidatus Micrarchaeota archaeon]